MYLQTLERVQSIVAFYSGLSKGQIHEVEESMRLWDILYRGSNANSAFDKIVLEISKEYKKDKSSVSNALMVVDITIGQIVQRIENSDTYF